MQNYTIEDLYIALQSVNEARYAMAAVFALQIYELAACIGLEFRLICKSRWTSLKFAYILCRYYPLFLWPLVMWAYIGDHTVDLCSHVGRAVHSLLAPCQFFSQAVMLMRAYAFCGRDKRILCLLLLCYGGLVGLDIWVFCAHVYVPPMELYLVLHRTGCFPNYGTGITASRIGYTMLAAVLMDLISLSVVLIHCVRTRSREVSLGRYFVTQGLSAFALVSGVNIISAVMYFRPPSFRNGLGLPIIVVFPNIVACRVILDLRAKVLPTDSEISRQHSMIIRNALDSRRIRDAWGITSER